MTKIGSSISSDVGNKQKKYGRIEHQFQKEAIQKLVEKLPFMNSH